MGNYDIVKTDYENYSIVYSCKNYFGIYHMEFIWILTRKQNPSVELINELVDYIVKKLKYPKDRIRFTKQGGDCIY